MLPPGPPTIPFVSRDGVWLARGSGSGRLTLRGMLLSPLRQSSPPPLQLLAPPPSTAAHRSRPTAANSPPSAAQSLWAMTSTPSRRACSILPASCASPRTDPSVAFCHSRPSFQTFALLRGRFIGANTVPTGAGPLPAHRSSSGWISRPDAGKRCLVAAHISIRRPLMTVRVWPLSNIPFPAARACWSSILIAWMAIGSGSGRLSLRGMLPSPLRQSSQPPLLQPLAPSQPGPLPTACK